MQELIRIAENFCLCTLRLNKMDAFIIEWRNAAVNVMPRWLFSLGYSINCSGLFRLRIMIEI